MRKHIVFLFFLLAMPWILQAQIQLSGMITGNDNHQPLAGANVVLGNAVMATATDSNGHFVFNGLKPGEYNIKVSFVGFKSKTLHVNLLKNKQIQLSLEPTSYLSDEVIISAVRVQAASPTTHENISGKVLNKNNTGQDLPFLLRMTPSIVVTSDAGAGVGYTGMRIRGVDLTGINVTLNGVPVNDAESQGVYFVDLPDLASSVDNIQIQRGVGTSGNGSAAFGASINIKTDRFDPHAFAEIGSMAGSFGTLKNTVRLGSGLLHKHWLVNGRFSLIRSDGYIDRASSNLRSGYLSAGYYGKKDIFKAIVMMGHEKTYQAWYGVPKDSLATNRTYNPAGAIYDENGNFLGYYKDQTDNYTQNYYQLHYAHQFNKKLNLAAALFLTRGFGYYNSYKNHQKFSKYGMNDTVIGGETITATNLIRQKWLDNYFYGFNLTGNYRSARSTLSFGGGWNHYDGDHYGKIVWAQVARLGDYDRNWYFNTGLKTDANVFAKWDFRISEHLSATADMQYRHIDYQIKGTHDDLRDLTQHHSFNFLNPKAGLSYAINPRSSFYFSFGVSHREPNRSVYRDADPGQDVRSERLVDYELGYKLAGSGFSLNTNLFYMDYKDQLVLTGKINNVGSAIMTNVPKSYRAGLEISAAWKITHYLSWNANVSVSRNKIIGFTEYVDNWNYWDDPANQPYQYSKYLGTTDISFSPDIVSGSMLTYTPVKDFAISWISKYVGRQYIDNTSSKERSLNPYWVNNLHFDYTLHLKGVESLGFVLHLNNIFNEKYETNAWVYRYVYNGRESEMNGYFPQAGFNFMAGINLKF
jgi:iron complex outermembrane receptor protein